MMSKNGRTGKALGTQKILVELFDYLRYNVTAVTASRPENHRQPGVRHLL
jgi:hypothetical protein